MKRNIICKLTDCFIYFTVITLPYILWPFPYSYQQRIYTHIYSVLYYIFSDFTLPCSGPKTTLGSCNYIWTHIWSLEQSIIVQYIRMNKDAMVVELSLNTVSLVFPCCDASSLICTLIWNTPSLSLCKIYFQLAICVIHKMIKWCAIEECVSRRDLCAKN